MSDAKSNVYLSSLVKVAVEYWRLSRSYLRNMAHSNSMGKVQAIIRNTEVNVGDALNAAGLHIVSYEGMQYDPNLPLTVINDDEFEDMEGLIVGQVIEPVVMLSQKVLHTGKVILIKGE